MIISIFFFKNLFPSKMAVKLKKNLIQFPLKYAAIAKAMYKIQLFQYQFNYRDFIIRFADW